MSRSTILRGSKDVRGDALRDQPKRATVRAYSNRVELQADAELTPGEARLLAAALLEMADAAEPKKSRGERR